MHVASICALPARSQDGSCQREDHACRFSEGKGTGAVFNALFEACVQALRDVDLPARSQPYH